MLNIKVLDSDNRAYNDMETPTISTKPSTDVTPHLICIVSNKKNPEDPTAKPTIISSSSSSSIPSLPTDPNAPRVISSAQVSRALLHEGFTIIDIKPQKLSKERTSFVFRNNVVNNISLDDAIEELKRRLIK